MSFIIKFCSATAVLIALPFSALPSACSAFQTVPVTVVDMQAAVESHPRIQKLIEQNPDAAKNISPETIEDYAAAISDVEKVVAKLAEQHQIKMVVNFRPKKTTSDCDSISQRLKAPVVFHKRLDLTKLVTAQLELMHQPGPRNMEKEICSKQSSHEEVHHAVVDLRKVLRNHPLTHSYAGTESGSTFNISKDNRKDFSAALTEIDSVVANIASEYHLQMVINTEMDEEMESVKSLQKRIQRTVVCQRRLDLTNMVISKIKAQHKKGNRKEKLTEGSE